MVSETSSVFSAISFGVFLRDAPSTSAIMRSRKLLPGSEVMRIFSQSETTVVPPVTEQKSPPDSRTTGADSPVMADSSTDAMPSITSPSPGMISPAETMTTSPFLSSLDITSLVEPSSCSRCASVSFCVLRRLAACALPRPSATDSAEVREQHGNQQDNCNDDIVNAGVCRRVSKQSGHERQKQRDEKADFNHEHDGILHHVTRIQLGKGADDCLTQDLGRHQLF